jgi:hypothetical protein
MVGAFLNPAKKYIQVIIINDNIEIYEASIDIVYNLF